MAENNGKFVPPPRRETKLTDQQERFVLEYLVDLDPQRALLAAGYNPTTDASRDVMISNLLRNVKVRAFLFEMKAEYRAAYKMDAATWLNHLRLIALEAYEAQEWAGAVAAMREIGKHLGCYELDHAQKKAYTEADAERLRAELVARGMDFSRKNFPKSPHVNGSDS